MFKVNKQPYIKYQLLIVVRPQRMKYRVQMRSLEIHQHHELITDCQSDESQVYKKIVQSDCDRN